MIRNHKLRSNRKSNRRGITLVFVISMIVLFMLLGSTFAVVSSNYLKSAKNNARREIYRDSPQVALERTLNRLLRNTADRNSSLWSVGLGADMYGYKGFKATVSLAKNDRTYGNDGSGNLNVNTGQSIIVLELNPTIHPANAKYGLTGGANLTIPNGRFDGGPFILSDVDDTYNGQILTFLSGPARNTSLRIIRYVYDPTMTRAIFTCFIEPTDNANAFASSNAIGAAVTEFGGVDILINPKPFSGWGAGEVVSPAPAPGEAHFVGAADYNSPLNIHRAGDFASVFDATGNLTGYLQGGVNEEYDAADYQTPFLAFVNQNSAAYNNLNIIPSMHRPALIQYMAATLPAQNNVHRYCMRPVRNLNKQSMYNAVLAATGSIPQAQAAANEVVVEAGIDFPNGVSAEDNTAGNPNAQPNYLHATGGGPVTRAEFYTRLANARDVDNDGDAVLDSVWIDPGYPVQTDKSGRQFKTLVAVLIKDLDGKININAAGNGFQTNYAASNVPQNVVINTATTTSVNTNDATITNRGPGYGPAGANLGAIFRDVTDHRNIMGLTSVPGFYGKYGADGRPGFPNVSSSLWQDRFFNYPGARAAPFNTLATGVSFNGKAFRSYCDINERFAVAINENGMPVTGIPAGNRNETIDNPYEIDLVSAPVGDGSYQRADQPFTEAELEAVWRRNDIDAAQLPQRLLRLSPDRLGDVVGNTDRNDAYRSARSITTRSFEVPVPPYDLRAKLLEELEADFPDPQDRASQANQMLSNSILQGLAFDLNTPFGNGIDDNPNSGVFNFVIDEHSGFRTGTAAAHIDDESVTRERVQDTTYGTTTYFDNDSDGLPNGTTPADPNQYLARHNFAKTLYVLMVLMKPDREMPVNPRDFDEGSPVAGLTAEQMQARINIAQWAANVVDFRDTDAIMTPFEFDLNPLNGWQVDGNIFTTGDGPERFVVWGSERPELLITKVLATHDRATQDLATEGAPFDGGGADGMANNTTNGDRDFDQSHFPRGTFHFELTNPWIASRPIDPPALNTASVRADPAQVPAELYGFDGTDNGVEISRVNRHGSPVWRVMVAKDAGINRDPDTPSSDAADQIDVDDQERLVYFCPEAAARTVSDTATRTLGEELFVPVGGVGQLVVAGGKRAVIGTSREVTGTTHTIRFGKTNDATPTLRGISLDIGTPAATGRCTVFQPSLGVNHECCVVPMTDLNVSESLDYDKTGLDPMTRIFATPKDEPLDKVRSDSEFFNRDGTRDEPFREIHLQRLANPLLPFHATRNPFRTIDSMYVDLTVYNGEGIAADMMTPERQRSPSWITGANQNPLFDFTTKERGKYEANRTPMPVGNGIKAGDRVRRERLLWGHEPDSPAITATQLEDATDTVHFFKYNLQVKDAGGNPLATSFGAENLAYDRARNAAKFAGRTPAYPWLTWNDRLFANKYELMMTPRSRSSRLLHDFSVDYQNMTHGYSTGANDRQFGHLLNFFQTDNDDNFGSDFYKIFDVVDVPSRYEGTEEILNPNFFRANLNSGTGISETGINRFNAPYNRISSYRYPGKVNPNTISQRQVFESMYGRYETNAVTFYGGHFGPHWRDFTNLRAGYATGTRNARNSLQSIKAADAAYPTFFHGVFRSPENGDKVPVSGTSLVREGVECTILRRDEFGSPLFANIVDQTLVGDNGSSSSHPSQKVRGNTATLPNQIQRTYFDDARNPHFRYEGLRRLGSMTSNQSNVYSIWITTGYFELDALGRLGREVGSDRGEVKRHRMFSMVDRSIPFGYEPGKNHNVERIILTKRFIE